MPYSVPFSDPGKSSNPITVNDLTENNTSTSLSLVGRNYSNYGVAFAKNFVHLLEHFASPSAPSNSVEGQIWYDNNKKRLYVNDSTGGNNNWRPASGTHIATSAGQVQNALLGDLWVNTLTQQLNLFNGTDWVLIGPTALAGKKSGVYVEQILDSAGVQHFVTIEYNNDSAIKISATESFVPQKTIEGFVALNPGVNITSKKFIGPTDTTVANTIAKIYGTATAAESLNVTNPTVENVSANQFARRDAYNLFYGQQSILNDAGLSIGTASSLSLTMVQGTAVIKNAADGGAIDLVVNYQGTNNTIVKIDGKNKRVGINHPTPNVELDVNGSAYINGHLTMTGTVDSSSPTTGSFQSRGGAGIAKNLYVGKNIVSNGRLTVGELNASGGVVENTSAILPNAHLKYDIGSSTSAFKKVYAQEFVGTFSGAITADVTGNLIGSAQSLSQSTTFQLKGDLSSPSPTTSYLAGGILEIDSSLNDSAIKGRTEVLDNRTDDSLLIYRANVGLRRVTRTNFLLGEAFVPIGSIFPFAATQIPLGYLLCDGSLVSRAEYPYLYQAIGTVYGQGAGGAYFRLPDLRGRFPLGNVDMTNPLANPTISKLVGFMSGSSTTVPLSNTDNITIGMQVTGDNSVPTGTVVMSIPDTGTVVLNNAVQLTTNTTLTFTLVVLKDTIPVNSTDRVGNVTGDYSPSSMGGTGGSSAVSKDISTTGSNPYIFSSGVGNTLNREFNVNVTNPYLTINYIIRAGVGSTQLA